MAKTFQLPKPLTVHGDKGPQEITEITLRDPTGKELFDIGIPFQQINHRGGGSETKVDGVALRRWIGVLSGIEGTALDALPVSFIVELSTWLAMQISGDDVKN